MFARKVAVRLKPNSLTKFTNLMVVGLNRCRVPPVVVGRG
jgi:hypothetical protein